MKKAVIFLALLTVVSLAFLSAQEEDKKTESELYPKHIYVARIWAHKLGYRIDYMRDDRTVGTIYAPIEWFQKSGGFAQLGYEEGEQSPYMVVFFKEGKVSHFRVFAQPEVRHITWGTVPSSENWDDRFNVEEPVFQLLSPEGE